MLVRIAQSIAPSITGGDNYVYTWAAVPQGSAASVNISVPGSASADTWQVAIGGNVITKLTGGNSIGGLYLGAGDTLTLTGTPSANPGPATVLGVQGTVLELPPSVPGSSSSSVDIGEEVTVTGDMTATITGPVDVTGSTVSLASGSTIAVSSGTVDIGNTPAVTITSGSVGISSGTVDIGNTPTVNIAASQVVQVTNEPSGQLTVAGTVDATVAGNVTIDAGTVDVQPVQSAQLASVVTPTQDTTTLTVTPDAKAVALAVLTASNASITVSGNTTGNAYPISSGASEGWTGTSAFYAGVDSSYDTSYTVTIVQPPNQYRSIWVSAIYAGVTAIINPIVDGGGVVTNLVLDQATGGFISGFTNPTGCSYVFILSSLGADAPPNVGTLQAGTGSEIAPYYPTRLLSIESDGSTWWETFVEPPNTELAIQFPVPNSPTVSIWASTKPSNLPTCKTFFTVTVPNPAAGADWSYTLPFSAKLKAVSAQLNTSGTVATRYPTFVGLLGRVSTYAQYIAMTPSGISASNSAHLQGWAGTPGLPVVNTGSPGLTMFTFPDIALGVTNVITSVTFNIQSGDQWSGINLTFSA